MLSFAFLNVPYPHLRGHPQAVGDPIYISTKIHPQVFVGSCYPSIFDWFAPSCQLWTGCSRGTWKFGGTLGKREGQGITRWWKRRMRKRRRRRKKRKGGGGKLVSLLRRRRRRRKRRRGESVQCEPYWGNRNALPCSRQIRSPRGYGRQRRRHVQAGPCASGGELAKMLV